MRFQKYLLLSFYSSNTIEGKDPQSFETYYGALVDKSTFQADNHSTAVNAYEKDNKCSKIGILVP